MFPFVSVDVIEFPLKLRLSTVSSVIPATEVVAEPRVTYEHITTKRIVALTAKEEERFFDNRDSSLWKRKNV
jgi:hypothetical protein